MFDKIRRLLRIEPHENLAVAYLRTPQPTFHIRAKCFTCKRYHDIIATQSTYLSELDRWNNKHPMGEGHRIELIQLKRKIPGKLFDKIFQEFNYVPWWLSFKENADFKIAYASSAAYTCGLHSTPLASSSTAITGRESTAISNLSAALYLGYNVGGKITSGTAPTTGTISIFLYGSIDDTPTYPDVLDGTDSDETFTSVDIRQASTVFFQETATDTTSNRTYWFRPQNIAPFFGGILPKNHGLFVAQNTGVALNSTAGNHVLSYTGAYVTG